jgi:hypothetical protein
MKLTPMEGELLTFFIVCWRSDVTSTMASRTATVDMAVKWRLIRESELNSHMEDFCGTSSENSV